MDVLCMCTVYEWFLEKENWKDFILPILTGLAIPALIFALTVGKENYNRIYGYYIFKESLRTKIQAWRMDMRASIVELDNQRRTLNADNSDVVRFHLPGKNVEDLRALSYERIIESFLPELDHGTEFIGDLSNLEESINIVLSIIKDYPVFLHEFNAERVHLHNENVMYLKEITTVVDDSMIRVALSKNDNITQKWIAIQTVWEKIKYEENTFDEQTSLLNELKNLSNEAKQIHPSSPDSANTIFRLSEKILGNMSIIPKSIHDFNTQFEQYIRQYRVAIERVDRFLPKIKAERPKMIHIFKYIFY